MLACGYVTHRHECMSPNVHEVSRCGFHLCLKGSPDWESEWMSPLSQQALWTKLTKLQHQFLSWIPCSSMLFIKDKGKKKKSSSSLLFADIKPSSICEVLGEGKTHLSSKVSTDSPSKILSSIIINFSCYFNICSFELQMSKSIFIFIFF